MSEGGDEIRFYSNDIQTNWGISRGTLPPNRFDYSNPKDPFALYQEQERARREGTPIYTPPSYNWDRNNQWKDLFGNDRWGYPPDPPASPKKKKKRRKKKKKPKISVAVPKPQTTPSPKPPVTPPVRPPVRSPVPRPVTPPKPPFEGSPPATLPKQVTRPPLFELMFFPLRSLLLRLPWAWLIAPSQLQDGTIPDHLWEEWSAPPEELPREEIETGPDKKRIVFRRLTNGDFALTYRHQQGSNLIRNTYPESVTFHNHWVWPSTLLPTTGVPGMEPTYSGVPGTFAPRPGKVREPTARLDIQIDEATGNITARIKRATRYRPTKPLRERDKKFSGSYGKMLAWIGVTIGNASEAADFLEAIASNIYMSDGTRAVLVMSWDQAVRGLVHFKDWELDMPGAMASWMAAKGQDSVFGKFSKGATKHALDAGWTSPLGLAGKVDMPSIPLDEQRNHTGRLNQWEQLKRHMEG